MIVFDNPTVLFGTTCLACAAIHIISEWHNWRPMRSVSKIAASTSFLVLAVINGATDSAYGRLVLIALILSWVGDILLLSLRSVSLLCGIAAFFFAHVLFTAAFASLPLNVTWLIIGTVILVVSGLWFLRWMRGHLESLYKVAVPVYLIAITLMTAFAIAAGAASGSAVLAIGAILFVASDVSVARDRFIAKSIVNKIWGLPLYYAAQNLFAVSVPLFR